MKSGLIRLADRFMTASGLFGRIIAAAARRGAKLILCYHRISATTDLATAEGLVVRPEDLESQLALLSAHFTHARLDELIAYRGDAPIFAVTFDDGFRDNLVEAAPVLESLSMRGAFFICTNTIGSNLLFWQNTLQALARLNPAFTAELQESARKELFSLHPFEASRRTREIAARYGIEIPSGATILNEHELRELSRRGHEVYTHTKSHPVLASLSRDEVIDEIEGSRKVLERILAANVARIIAYPFGRPETLPSDIDAIMREMEYDAGLIVKHAFYDEARDGRYAIPRLPIDRDDRMPRFRMKKLLPLAAVR